MDIYSFVNSKSIRDYLRDINYNFNSKEAAWLIYQCNSLSMKEKYEAWEQLMQEMTDFDLGSRFDYIPGSSLFELIRSYISITTNQYDTFSKKNENAIYQYRFYCTDDCDWCEDYEGIYASLEDCWNEIEVDLDLGIEIIDIRKRYIGTNETINVRFKPDKTVLAIDATLLSDEESMALGDGFESFWFDFPVPFEKGDILAPVNIVGPGWKLAENGPVVMDGVIPWDKEFCERNQKENFADSSDMNIWGYFQDDDGRIFHEVTFNYMDYDYYRGPFMGKRRLLVALSNFIKEKISLELLLCAYRKVIMDEISDDVMLHSWYTPEDLSLAGLDDVVKANERKAVESGLNPRKTFGKRFSTDVEYDWSNNSELLDKCIQIASNYYQPKEMLFVYGEHGCGKTTILQCLGNYARQLSRPELLYVTAENFVNDVINAIRSGTETMAELRSKYRKLDFLILEDIQILCGKDNSAREFANTLNDLLTKGAQVVISSDRPLDELNLPEELKSKISFATQMKMN